MIKDCIVREWGATKNGAVVVPGALIGKRVWVVSDEDVNDLTELIKRTLLVSRLQQFTDDANKDRINDLESRILARITSLEKVVYDSKPL